MWLAQRPAVLRPCTAGIHLPEQDNSIPRYLYDATCQFYRLTTSEKIVWLMCFVAIIMELPCTFAELPTCSKP